MIWYKYNKKDKVENMSDVDCGSAIEKFYEYHLRYLNTDVKIDKTDKKFGFKNKDQTLEIAVDNDSLFFVNYFRKSSRAKGYFEPGLVWEVESSKEVEDIISKFFNDSSISFEKEFINLDVTQPGLLINKILAACVKVVFALLVFVGLGGGLVGLFIPSSFMLIDWFLHIHLIIFKLLLVAVCALTGIVPLVSALTEKRFQDRYGVHTGKDAVKVALFYFVAIVILFVWFFIKGVTLKSFIGWV